MPLITSRLRDIAGDYDAFILDLWGTVHDGIQPLPGAVDCLDRLRAAGKGVVLLSNAPRRAAHTREMLATMGITADHYDHVFTSGEATWRALAERPDDWYRGLGRKAYFFGPVRDEAMLDNPGIDRVTDLDVADFILAIGFDTSAQTVDDFVPFLERAAALQLPMVCANPDLVVHRGTTLEYCAGALAACYEDRFAGVVRYEGKPHPGVYHSVMGLLGLTDVTRVMMVGDGLRTDIAGAQNLGMPSAFLPGGISGDDLGIGQGDTPDEAALQDLFKTSGHTPTTTLPALVW